MARSWLADDEATMPYVSYTVGSETYTVFLLQLFSKCFFDVVYIFVALCFFLGSHKTLLCLSVIETTDIIKFLNVVCFALVNMYVFLPRLEEKSWS